MEGYLWKAGARRIYWKYKHFSGHSAVRELLAYRRDNSVGLKKEGFWAAMCLDAGEVLWPERGVRANECGFEHLMETLNHPV